MQSSTSKSSISFDKEPEENGKLNNTDIIPHNSALLLKLFKILQLSKEGIEK